jgi:hypothetical protein
MIKDIIKQSQYIYIHILILILIKKQQHQREGPHGTQWHRKWSFFKFASVKSRKAEKQKRWQVLHT